MPPPKKMQELSFDKIDLINNTIFDYGYTIARYGNFIVRKKTISINITKIQWRQRFLIENPGLPNILYENYMRDRFDLLYMINSYTERGRGNSDNYLFETCRSIFLRYALKEKQNKLLFTQTCSLLKELFNSQWYKLQLFLFEELELPVRILMQDGVPIVFILSSLLIHRYTSLPLLRYLIRSNQFDYSYNLALEDLIRNQVSRVDEYDTERQNEFVSSFELIMHEHGRTFVSNDELMLFVGNLLFGIVSGNEGFDNLHKNVQYRQRIFQSVVQYFSVNVSELQVKFGVQTTTLLQKFLLTQTILVGYNQDRMDFLLSFYFYDETCFHHTADSMNELELLVTKVEECKKLGIFLRLSETFLSWFTKTVIHFIDRCKISFWEKEVWRRLIKIIPFKVVMKNSVVFKEEMTLRGKKKKSQKKTNQRLF